jgi:hypothetical protein
VIDADCDESMSFACVQCGEPILEQSQSRGKQVFFFYFLLLLTRNEQMFFVSFLQMNCGFFPMTRGGVRETEGDGETEEKKKKKEKTKKKTKKKDEASRLLCSFFLCPKYLAWIPRSSNLLFPQDFLTSTQKTL